MLGFESKQDMIEKLYLKSIVDSYNRIDKVISIENDIRDRFVKDIIRDATSPLYGWLQLKLIRIHWEICTFTDSDDLGRMDLSFETHGFDFIVECKRLKGYSKKYFDEGLMRFIELKYAKGDDYAAMMGFVVDGDRKNILAALKKNSLKYSSIDSLFAKEVFPYTEDGFKGSHLRTDDTIVNIYNVLFDFKEA